MTEWGAATIPQRSRFKIEPRYKIVLACFLATFCMYAERVGFSIAFTALAKKAALDESVKGTVMSAFYWGYALSQVCACMHACPCNACDVAPMEEVDDLT